MPDSKKKVLYKELIMLKEGIGAVVLPINHTSAKVSNKKPVFTSKVIKVLSETSFETENSIYVKEM